MRLNYGLNFKGKIGGGWEMRVLPIEGKEILALVVRESDGFYRFLDRMKDAIRRRGENISSFEVEAEVCAHPAVKEAAAVAVPSEHGEDEVLVAISLAPGAELDPADLIGFLIPGDTLLFTLGLLIAEHVVDRVYAGRGA